MSFDCGEGGTPKREPEFVAILETIKQLTAQQLNSLDIANTVRTRLLGWEVEPEKDTEPPVIGESFADTLRRELGSQLRRAKALNDILQAIVKELP